MRACPPTPFLDSCSPSGCLGRRSHVWSFAGEHFRQGRRWPDGLASFSQSSRSTSADGALDAEPSWGGPGALFLGGCLGAPRSTLPWWVSAPAVSAGSRVLPLGYQQHADLGEAVPSPNISKKARGSRRHPLLRRVHAPTPTASRCPRPRFWTGGPPARVWRALSDKAGYGHPQFPEIGAGLRSLKRPPRGGARTRPRESPVVLPRCELGAQLRLRARRQPGRGTACGHLLAPPPARRRRLPRWKAARRVRTGALAARPVGSPGSGGEVGTWEGAGPHTLPARRRRRQHLAAGHPATPVE